MLLTSALRGEHRSHPSNPDAWLIRGVWGHETASGIAVTAETALSLSAYWCGVRILAESMAQLPLLLYRRLPGGGKERAADHPLYSIVHDQANREQTSFEWREMMQGHLVLRGNAYSQKVRDNGGRLRELVPLHPDRVHPRRAFRSAPLVYEWQPLEGEVRTFSADQILHLPGLSFDGVKGCTPIEVQRESIGAAVAEQRFAARFFSNDASPGGVLTHPSTLSPAARKNLKESWKQTHSGHDNAHDVAVLEEGMTWTTVGVAAKDAQLIESRKFSVSEIARILNLPPHMLKDLDRATHSNIEHQGIEFVTISLLPWIRRWEQRLNMALLTEAERQSHFFEFLVEGFMRGDSKTRAEALKIQREGGALNADEWREIENRNPLPNGEGQIYLVPMNMRTTAEVMSDQDPDDDPPDPENRRVLPSPENRNFGRVRLRLRTSYYRLFFDAGGRIVRKETKAVRRQAKKLLGERNAQAWRDWLNEFYREHEGYIRRTMAPVVAAYGEAIFDATADEVGLTERDQRKLDAFIAAYVGALSTRHVLSSKRQLAEIATTAEAGTLLVSIEQRLAEWNEKRPAKIAMRETVQGGEAIASEAYSQGGVQKLVWEPNAGACPICLEMAGRTVEISGYFAGPGDRIEGNEQTPTLEVKQIIRHPPLHEGCACGVAPG